MTPGTRAVATTFLCDTSVLVAAADRRHVHHEMSIAVIGRAVPSIAYCAAHAIAEVYATLTSAAYRSRMRGADVGDVLDSIRKTFTAVSLTPEEYFAVAQEGLVRNTQSGQIYDALHLAVAVHANVEQIYTWNVKHFQALAPATIANRIRTP